MALRALKSAPASLSELCTPHCPNPPQPVLGLHSTIGYQPILRGGSSMVEPQSSKLITRVRFPSAPPKGSLSSTRVQKFTQLTPRRLLGSHRGGLNGGEQPGYRIQGAGDEAKVGPGSAL